MLIFNEEDHSYFWNEEQVPSVTQIITDTGLINTQFYTLDAQERGKLVHKACEFMDYDDLDFASLDPVIEPYVMAYKNFKEETGFKAELIEKSVYHKEFNYAGTLDRTGTMDGRRVLIDLKTSKSIDRIVGLQLAAYEMALYDLSFLDRYALQLKQDGTYLLHPFKESSDRLAFEGACKLYHWKKGVKKQRVRRAA